MPKVWVIRHGATALNASPNSGSDSPECIRGWSNIPLSAEGEKDARRLASELKRNNDLDALVTSDLDRALHTARIISDLAKIPLIGITLGLRPWNVGKFTGQPVSKCHRHLSVHAEHLPSTPLPGGESFNNFKDRTLDGLRSILEAFPNMTLGLVTHHRDERLLAAWNKQGQQSDYSIDLGEFVKKGEPTGSYWELNVNDHFARNEQQRKRRALGAK